MSKVFSLHHVVFGTKGRECVLNPECREMLHSFIWHHLNESGCYMYRINSMPDHVHILFNLNPTKALSKVVGDIKAYSSAWMKKKGAFPLFKGWGEGYYAASISRSHQDDVIKYINNQQTHHGLTSYIDEMKRLYLKAGMQWFDDELT